MDNWGTFLAHISPYPEKNHSNLYLCLSNSGHSQVVGAHVVTLLSPSNGASIFLLLNTFLELLDLIFKKFSQEFSKFVKSDFSTFIIVEDAEDDFMSFLQIISVLTIWRVNAFKQSLDERLDLLLFQWSTVVSVNGIKDRLVDLCELFLVD